MITDNGKKIVANASGGISAHEPYVVLGVARRSDGWIINYINYNAHGKTCKWSKVKPVRSEVPWVSDFFTNDASTHSGIYAGSIRQSAGKPIYWGMEYPMNTAEQNYCGKPTQYLMQICYEICSALNGAGHPNYRYCPPDSADDYPSFDHWDGYRHDTGAFLDAGVSGSTGGAPYSTHKILGFESSEVRFYAMVPADAIGWEFRDLIPEPGSYHFVVELYKWEQFTKSASNGDKTGEVPFAVLASKSSLNTTDRTISFGIPVSALKSLHGAFAQNGTTQIAVCVGFNKLSPSVSKTDKGGYWQLPTASYAAGPGLAFVAPWTPTVRRQLTLLEVFSGSVYRATLLQWASATSTDYKNLPTAATSVSTATMRFKLSLANDGTVSAFVASWSQRATGRLVFRATAVGNYNPSDSRNGGLVDREHPSMGLPRYLTVSSTPGLSATDVVLEAKAKQTLTFYTEAELLIPYGSTTGIRIEVSNDNGASWSVTGITSCYFNRN